MRAGDLARRTGVTVQALRHYEKVGLVVPTRLPNGYRDYDPIAVRQAEEIKELTGLGMSVAQTRPFVDCLATGHGSGDECPASLAVHRHAINELSERITRLRLRRDALATYLEAAAGRAVPTAAAARDGDGDGLAVRCRLALPRDDGATGHLVGLRLPALTLPATDGSTVRLAAVGAERMILYGYPLTGRRGVDLPADWDGIPGARGCTAEACGSRDHHDDLCQAAARVYGLSSQPVEYQRELVGRPCLPFAMLSDPGFEVRDALGLPSFDAGGMTLYRRFTMIVTDGVIEPVFCPVLAPEQHASQVLDWLRNRPWGVR